MAVISGTQFGGESVSRGDLPQLAGDCFFDRMDGAGGEAAGQPLRANNSGTRELNDWDKTAPGRGAEGQAEAKKAAAVGRRGNGLGRTSQKCLLCDGGEFPDEGRLKQAGA
jgi:hypothetical protein